MYQPPALSRKSSTPWDRLRTVKQDPLESVGFVSKGDHRLLNLKTQESYYHKITAHYMQFCAQHPRDLGDAFQSLSLESDNAAPDLKGDLSGLSLTAQASRPTTSSNPAKTMLNSTSKGSADSTGSGPGRAKELSNILTALRKLREAILATSTIAGSSNFSQRVHVFNIRLAILALHPESYHASLRYLLSSLHTQECPLPQSELREMTAYLILDTALRLNEIGEARVFQLRARQRYGFRDANVDAILDATVNNNWPLFWRTRSRVDGYVRALMHWRLPEMRKSALKAIGRSYMKCDIAWIIQSSTGGELTWDELVQQEKVGWMRDGNIAIIRKPKMKT